jgi:hypothetical protein
LVNLAEFVVVTASVVLDNTLAAVLEAEAAVVDAESAIVLVF